MPLLHASVILHRSENRGWSMRDDQARSTTEPDAGHDVNRSDAQNAGARVIYARPTVVKLRLGSAVHGQSGQTSDGLGAFQPKMP